MSEDEQNTQEDKVDVLFIQDAKLNLYKKLPPGYAIGVSPQKNMKQAIMLEMEA